jgi:hypothetical protein
MTKLIFLTVDGRATVENTRLGTRLVEMKDGYHPLTNDSVWQDAERLRPPAVVMVSGVLGPYGSEMTKEDIQAVLYDIELAERAFKKPSVSKIWQRQLAWLWGVFTKYAVVLFIVGILGFALYNQYLGGH